MKRATKILWCKIIICLLAAIFLLYVYPRTKERRMGSSDESYHIAAVRAEIISGPDTNSKVKNEKHPISPSSHVLCYNISDWIDCETKCLTEDKFQHAVLITDSGNISICIHNPSDDVWVSAAILKYGAWEADLMHLVWNKLRKHEDSVFLDIGSHVGEYSLMAAKLGREAYAVDPLLGNVQRLYRSVQENAFKKPLHIIHNAVSDKIGTVSLSVSRTNVGATKAIEGGEINTVCLDNFLTFVDSKTVVMKIDVENMEHKVLSGGHQFFKRNHVVLVAMEWASHNTNPSGMDIITFMNQHDLEAYDKTLSHKLNYSDPSLWTGDIFWLSKSNVSK